MMWNIDKVDRSLHQWNNFYMSNVMFKKLDEKGKKLLEKNSQFKGKFKGRRCFVIGNGPSVNQLDFNMMQDEITITVNEMFRHNDFLKLKSNFHFMADPFYFKLNRLNGADREILEKIYLLRESGTTLFVPMESAECVKRYGWKNKLDINYFSSQLFFYDNYKEDIDFTKYIPAFQAVVQWGIAFAIYLGCNEVYLLGCDATNIATDLSLFVRKDCELSYAYKLTEDVAENVKRQHLGLGLERLLNGYGRIVHLFGELNKYCKQKGVKLYNCSEESILENIPKRNVEDLFSCGKVKVWK